MTFFFFLHRHFQPLSLQNPGYARAHNKNIFRQYFCFSLIEEASLYILRNFEDISRSSNFLQLSYDDFKELIADDRLNARAEEYVCEAIFRWVLTCSSKESLTTSYNIVY